MRSKIITNYIYNFLYQLLVLIVPLITYPYLARVLGAEALGTYSYVAASASVVSTIGLFGLKNYGVRQTAYTGADEGKINMMFWEITLLRIFLFCFGIIVYIILGAVSGLTTEFGIYLPWLFSAYIVDISWIFVGKEDMKPTVIKNAIAKIASVIGIFLLVKESNDLWKYIALISISTLIANSTIWFSVNKYIGKPKVRFNNMQRHLFGAIKLFLPQVASVFYLQVDKLMLKWIAGSQQIAFYDQAEKIINIPLTFITVLSSVMMPRIANEFANKNSGKISSLINNANKFSAFLAIPLMFGICGIAKRFIPWYLGEEFLPVVTVIYFISPIIIFNSFSAVFGGQYLTATDQIKTLTKSYFSAAIVNVILNSITIPIFGCVGAAISTLMSSFITVLIQYMSVHKQINPVIFDKSMLKYIISGLLMLAEVVFIGEAYNKGVITTFIQIVCGVLTYFLILLLLREKFMLELIKRFKKERKK